MITKESIVVGLANSQEQNEASRYLRESVAGACAGVWNQACCTMLAIRWVPVFAAGVGDSGQNLLLHFAVLKEVGCCEEEFVDPLQVGATESQY